MKKDLISIKDLSLGEIKGIFNLTGRLKNNKKSFSDILSGKTIALIFQKPSNRTRVSFEVGMYQLGGNSLYLSPSEIKLGVRESIKDVAMTLSRYVDGIVVRTYAHQICLDLAKYSSVPVINGLSDFSHPCQALADVYTVEEKFSRLKGIKLAYIGDGNNVCNSLLMASSKLGLSMSVAAPVGYKPDKNVVKEAVILSRKNKSSIEIFDKPIEAVKGADVIYTDVWASMGQEDEVEERKNKFSGFQVNKDLVKLAKKGALIMHCLPAHRGEEITDEIIDGKNSIVFDQAENRLHLQKAILIKLLGR